ncbi:hypothetical protein GCM10027176_13240 [Actinoallomurus bryophytorum]
MGRVLSVIDHANAVLHNGIGRYDVALEAASAACRHDELGSAATLPELVEAATRSGQPRLAESALERLVERTQACGTDWAIGVQLSSRALLSDGSGAEEVHQDAIYRLEHTQGVVDLARTHLTHGEWLRRESRRGDARTHLRLAHDMLAAIGAAGFAARAASSRSLTSPLVGSSGTCERTGRPTSSK